ncbi:MAG: hypothetical protein P857_668 [Candidatus Xenolissoclinum pacificiensis L6]|uniref:Uncharacterized protein n=1 Tax=Candidatus Xenolissoclinum pacificiensis L6 TaxID=1401685 RepID=W2UZ20_9RICK|nr:MAG: hypothetical protein P857_668 [Candidatus Xenolissoclinum pacificiensis L6]
MKLILVCMFSVCLFPYLSFASYSNAFYVMISRQKTLQTLSEVNANNIANNNTIGYHQDNLIMSEVIAGNSSKTSFNNDIGIYVNHTVGPLKHTNNTFDLAITKPHLYFGLLTEAGIRYTRNGQFRLNNNGVIVSYSGYPLSSAEGAPIYIPDDNGYGVSINSFGRVYSRLAEEIEENEISQIGIYYFPNQLEKTGDNLLYTDNNPQIPDMFFEVLQGFLEESNVSSLDATQNLVEIARNFESTTAIVKSYHKNINEVTNTMLKL